MEELRQRFVTLILIGLSRAFRHLRSSPVDRPNPNLQAWPGTRLSPKSGIIILRRLATGLTFIIGVTLWRRRRIRMRLWPGPRSFEDEERNHGRNYELSALPTNDLHGLRSPRPSSRIGDAVPDAVPFRGTLSSSCHVYAMSMPWRFPPSAASGMLRPSPSCGAG